MFKNKFFFGLLVLILVAAMGTTFLNGVGILFYRIDQFHWAERFYKLALKLGPTELSPLHNLGLLEKDRGHLEKAQVIYEKIILLKPDWGLVHKSLGACFHLQGRLRDAQKEYLRALLLNPKLASAWSNLGVLYFHQGKIKRALHCYHEALEFDPNDRITLSNYQRLNLKSGGVG